MEEKKMAPELLTDEQLAQASGGEERPPAFVCTACRQTFRSNTVNGKCACGGSLKRVGDGEEPNIFILGDRGDKPQFI